MSAHMPIAAHPMDGLLARLAAGGDRTLLLIEHLAPDGTLDSLR